MMVEDSAVVVVVEGDAEDVFRKQVEAAMLEGRFEVHRGPTQRGTTEIVTAVGPDVCWVLLRREGGQAIGARLGTRLARSLKRDVTVITARGSASAPDNVLQMQVELEAGTLGYSSDSSDSSVALEAATTALTPRAQAGATATTFPWSRADLSLTLADFLASSLYEAMVALRAGQHPRVSSEEPSSWRRRTGALPKRLERLRSLMQEASAPNFEPQPDGRFLVRVALADGSRQLSFLTSAERASLEEALQRGAA